MLDTLHMAVSVASLLFSVILIFFTISISGMFKGLPRLEKPWEIMLVGILFFILLQIADIMRSIGAGPEPVVSLIHDAAAMIFIALLGYSLYLFKRGWTVPKT